MNTTFSEMQSGLIGRLLRGTCLPFSRHLAIARSNKQIIRKDNGPDGLGVGSSLVTLTKGPVWQRLINLDLTVHMICAQYSEMEDPCSGCQGRYLLK